MSFFKCSECGVKHSQTTCPVCRSAPDAALPKPRGLPGIELEKIIPKFFKSDECGCIEYARKMDRWGIVGCERRFDEIVQYLCEQAKTHRITKHFGVVNQMVATAWTREAIDNARAAARVDDNGNWFVAITTAPRKGCTLQQTVDSVRWAGWEPTVFAEPGSTVTDADTITHDERHGVWRNWIASARYALDHTEANVIMTVQDDCAFHPDSRSFTESVLWPSDDCAFVSLYTPRHYTRTKAGRTRPRGVNRIVTQSLWGACALVWSRPTLERVLQSPTIASWRGLGPARKKDEAMSAYRDRREKWYQIRKDDASKIANSDTAIGVICNSLKLSMWFVDPSPVRHIAAHSSIGHGGNTGNRNCLRCADHRFPLAEQVASK